MKSNNPCITATVTKALELLPGPEGQRFAGVFRHGSLEVEIYAPRGTDPQQPHTHDEVYFVAAGTGEFVCGDTRRTFGPTDILFAAAGVVHRFENFSGDLTLWVLFYGPEDGEES
ncbi:MAG TPA: cupin domain-containing protein [Pyrinomonadaceae bacterium]|nr:cupin domain-containing protein [Pyrinomonadaceae bacterium]